MKSHLLSHRVIFFSRRVAEITEAASLTLAATVRMAHTPTRYESVGCDDENFSSLKEYEAKGEVSDVCSALSVSA